MSDLKFVYVTYIATTAERLWAALTNGAFTKQYWFKRRIESDWRQGSKVNFFDGDSDRLTDTGEVLKVEKPTLLSYSFQYIIDGEPMPPSRLTFEIRPMGSVVMLKVTHDQLASEADLEAFNNGWPPILSNLKTFLETGKSLSIPIW